MTLTSTLCRAMLYQVATFSLKTLQLMCRPPPLDLRRWPSRWKSKALLKYWRPILDALFVSLAKQSPSACVATAHYFTSETAETLESKRCTTRWYSLKTFTHALCLGVARPPHTASLSQQRMSFDVSSEESIRHAAPFK